MARFARIAATLSALVCVVAHAATQRFDLPAGKAGVTLLEFARQAKLSVVFNFNAASACQTRAIRGSMEPTRALHRMLTGSGLSFRFTDAKSIAVRLIRERACTAAPDGPDSIAQVRVLGTAYSGEIDTPMGVNPLRITAADIRALGVATPYDALRTLPQNFGGGPTEDTHLGRDAATNSAIGNGLNLRGLGSGATLVLVDGRPLAPSGTAGAFTDISNIPLAAIDHFDIFLDGGSVLYGGSAVGGIVNFVLRHADGVEFEGRMGGLTPGSMGEQRLSGFWGEHWDSGRVSLTYQYYERDPLWASARPQATSDLKPFGGTNFDTAAGNPGTVVSVSSGQTWAIPPGQKGTGLTPADFAAGTQNLNDRYTHTTVLPWEDLQSIIASGRQELGESWNLFADALVDSRHVRAMQAAETSSVLVTTTNPFYTNPVPHSTDPLEVLYGFDKDLGPLTLRNVVDSGQVTAGAHYAGASSWDGQLYVGYSFENQHQVQDNTVNYAALASALADPNPLTAFNPFGDGSVTNPQTVAQIRAQSQYRLRSNLQFANVTATGTLGYLPGGDLKLTLGTDYRIQHFDSSALASGPTPVTDTLGRRVLAVFEQLKIPLLGVRNALPGLAQLDLSGGLRYEHYSDVGQVVMPQFGFEASPLMGLTLRGTWGRLYRAPDLTDLSETANLSVITVLPDPKTPSGLSNVLVWTGNNASLRPETAKSWTLGGTYVPPFLPEASVALTYFKTVFSDLVGPAPDLSLSALSDPALTWLVSRNVSEQTRAYICQHTTFLGTAAECLKMPVGALIDLRLHNLTTIKTRGIDLIGRYTLELKRSTLTFGLLGTYILEYAEAQSVNSPLINVVNTPHDPIDVRLRGSLTWSYGGLSLAGFLNFQDAYHDTDSQSARHVPSWTTADATLSYVLPESWVAPFAGLNVSLNALNVFNSYPPFLNNSAEQIGYDEENGDLVGRAVSISVRKRW